MHAISLCPSGPCSNSVLPLTQVAFVLHAVLMPHQDKSGALLCGNAYLGGTLVMRLKQAPLEAYSSRYATRKEQQ